MAATHPLPYPRFKRDLAAHVTEPGQVQVSGEVTASVSLPVGMMRTSGRIKAVDMSVLASGKDDTNALNVAGDVAINGVSCLTTNPEIAHVSGEASQQKTTFSVAGDTGITAAVVDETANTYNAGDVITATFTLTRTASPTTEINTPAMMIEFYPDE